MQTEDVSVRILDEASRLFLQYGFKRTTVDDIASAVGIAKGSVYLHFQSKEAIFQAAGDKQIVLTLGLMAEIRDGADPPLTKLLRLLLETELHVWDFCHQAPHSPELWAEQLGQLGQPREDAFEKGRQIIADIVREGQAAGEIDGQLNSDETATLIQAAMRGFEMPYLHIRGREQIEQMLPKVLNMILGGIRPRCQAGKDGD